MNLYLVRNLLDSSIYVGKTTHSINDRWIRHLYNMKHGSQTHLHRAIRKYGVENFDIQPIVLVGDDITDEASLNDGERLMIRLLRVNCKLYNLTDGGEGVSGLKHSEETRRRISESQTGKTLSEEHRRNVGKSMIGRPVSDETRRRISDAKRGKRTQSYCKRGHERTPENVNKTRSCKMCQALGARAHRATRLKARRDLNERIAANEAELVRLRALRDSQ